MHADIIFPYEKAFIVCITASVFCLMEYKCDFRFKDTLQLDTIISGKDAFFDKGDQGNCESRREID